jgi:hypothetical protein
MKYQGFNFGSASSFASTWIQYEAALHFENGRHLPLGETILGGAPPTIEAIKRCLFIQLMGQFLLISMDI